MSKCLRHHSLAGQEIDPPFYSSQMIPLNFGKMKSMNIDFFGCLLYMCNKIFFGGGVVEWVNAVLCQLCGLSSACLLRFVSHKMRLYLLGDSYLLKPLGQHIPRENVPPYFLPAYKYVCNHYVIVNTSLAISLNCDYMGKDYT